MARPPPVPRPDLARMVERMMDLRALQARTDSAEDEDWWLPRQITPIERAELANTLRSLRMEGEAAPAGYRGIRVDIAGGWAWEWIPDA